MRRGVSHTTGSTSKDNQGPLGCHATQISLLPIIHPVKLPLGPALCGSGKLGISYMPKGGERPTECE